MKKLYALIYLIFAVQGVYAQNNKVYYLVDTAKIPTNDRLVKLRTENGIKQYDIGAPCFKRGYFSYLSAFSFSETGAEKTIIDSVALKNIRLTSLSDLIALACKSGIILNSTHDVFFIEPSKKQFMVYKVKFEFN